MSPAQHKQLNEASLCRTLRRMHALKKAWDHVKLKALKSRNEETRSAAANFQANELSNLRGLHETLRGNNFKFSKQHGFLKKRGAGKKPRPIVSSSIPDRIVQRAILDVCQSDNKRTRSLLGQIPIALSTRTSVGGIRDKGPAEAVRLISDAITSGATFFIRSDVKDFFTRIPKPKIAKFLEVNIEDSRFNDLFMAGLEIELANEDDVREWIDLFPFGEIGVAQGSALSALCANIVLREFDKTLNGRGITTIRYLDDFLILGPSKSSVDKVWKRASELLRALGMEAHNPDIGGGKAARGRVDDGFDFLSFHFRGRQIFPSQVARQDFLHEFRHSVSSAKREITSARKSPRRAQDKFVQFLTLFDRQVRGWGDAFSSTNQRVVFSQMDAEISKIIDSFWFWFQNAVRNVSANEKRRMTGIALLADTLVSNSPKPT